jgi:hypothetical protein
MAHIGDDPALVALGSIPLQLKLRHPLGVATGVVLRMHSYAPCLAPTLRDERLPQAPRVIREAAHLGILPQEALARLQGE